MSFLSRFGRSSQAPPSATEPPRPPSTSDASRVAYEPEVPEMPPSAIPAPVSPVENLAPFSLSDEEERPRLDLGLTEDYTLENLLMRLVELGASDLHLESGCPPVLRLKGDMLFSTLAPMSNERVEELLAQFVAPPDVIDRFARTGNADFAHEILEVARFRVNWLKQHRGVGCVTRVIPSKVPTLEDLKLPETLVRLAMSPRGIVLVTGPTGSGKSTTLAAMINHVNQNRRAHIITIEDPIEFTHRSEKCLIDHREVGLHARSFAAALKATLREDPDIVLVGEMRDLETIALALTAAEMGVLVFGTLHTNSAPKTVDRIIDVFPAEQQEQVRMQLSQSLRGVVAQQLLRKRDGSGRVAALEVMICNEGLRSLIREGKTSQIGSFIMMGKDEGMQTLDSVLIKYVKDGVITVTEALSRAQDLTAFKRAGLTS